MQQSDSPRGAWIAKGTGNVAFPADGPDRGSDFGKVCRDRMLGYRAGVQ